jgi:hypothetical protein
MTFLSSFNFLTAQTIDAKLVFSNTHGIKQERTTFYEVEGYSIFVESHNASFDEKGFKKIKKKYSINKEISPVNDLSFQTGKVLLKSENKTKIVTATSVYYLFPLGKS